MLFSNNSYLLSVSAVSDPCMGMMRIMYQGYIPRDYILYKQ